MGKQILAMTSCSKSRAMNFSPYRHHPKEVVRYLIFPGRFVVMIPVVCMQKMTVSRQCGRKPKC